MLLWKGERTVSLLTTGANALLAPVHERMPVIVPREDYAAWLDPARDAAALLAPYPAERMHAREVSRRVNRAEHDDPALIEALTSPSG